MRPSARRKIHRGQRCPGCFSSEISGPSSHSTHARKRSSIVRDYTGVRLRLDETAALSLRIAARQRAQVSDNGLRVGVIHVVDVHRWLDGQPVRTNSLLENLLALFFGELFESRQARRIHGPIRVVVNGRDPDWRALQTPRLIQIAAAIPRRVALLAHRHVLNQIPPSFDVATLLRGGRRLLCSLLLSSLLLSSLL